MVMLRPCAVLVSALALLAAFVWAPFEHIHTNSDLRHAHLTPHDLEHQHDTPDAPEQTPPGDEDILGVNAFLSAGLGTTVSLVGVFVSPVPLTSNHVTRYEAEREEARAHGPPARLRSPRAPPLFPAC